MGSKAAQTILPLVAIAAAVYTGGASLGLLGGSTAAGAGAATAGASVGSAVASGATAAGATAAGATAASATAAGATAAGATAAGATAAGASTLTAGEAAFLAQAQAAASAPIAQAAAAPWYQQAWTWLGANKGTVGLGISGASTAMGGISARNQAIGQENALKVQASQDGLALAERERNSQLNLSKVLASQNNLFAAVGADPSSGSAMQAQDAATAQAERELSLSGVYAGLQQSAFSMRRRAVSRAKDGAPVGALLDFGQSAYNVWRT